MAQSDPYTRIAGQHREPPRGLRQTLRHLGPGMILVGSVVGSGELIVTTKLGAVAGFTLLWFVLLSCLVKVVVQTELARHTIVSGETFLAVFNGLPGPTGRRPRWLTLRWMIAFVVASVAALAVFMHLEAESRTAPVAAGLAAAVAGAGWAAAAATRRRPSRSPARTALPPEPPMNWFTWLWLGAMLLIFVNSGAILGGAGQALELAFPGALGPGGARYWAILVACACAALLLGGTYASLERLLVVLVSSFTIVTLVCTGLLRWTDFAVSWADWAQGVALRMPDHLSTELVLTALAMYAGTGVAFGEMWNYTYWCVEKGYARNVGVPEPGAAWRSRARGWIRVMYTDAGLTMVVYTVSTVCFYVLGAAILHVQGLNPDGRETLATLSSIFVDGLGGWAAGLFLVGSFFVLFSTVLSGAAGYSRLLADVLPVIGLSRCDDYGARQRHIRFFIIASLALYTVAYWLFENPPQMLLVTSSLIGAVMYPALGLGTLYLRHRRLDPSIAPGRATTVWLWICGLVLSFVSPAGILLALALGAGWISVG